MDRVTLLFAALGLASCGMAMDARAGGEDGDDAGTDGDSDADSDADSDVDTDYGMFESADAGTCADGLDNDADTLVDCFAFGCREDVACCGADVPVLEEAFEAGLGGAWAPFGAPQVSTGSLYFPGGDHESGARVAEAVDPYGIVDASIVVDRPAGCAEACPAYGGIALTAQGSIGDASGVRPVAAIAFSAMDGHVRGVVDGVAVWVSDAEAVAPVRLHLRLRADGRADFEWTDADGGHETATSADPATRPETDLWVAAYGRGDARADDVSILRAACRGPKGGVRRGDVLAAGGWSAGGVRSPSVVSAAGRWLLYYDGATGIGRAESLDGVNWLPTPANAILEGPFASPGVVDVEPGTAGGRFLFAETWDDPGTRRIVLLRSSDEGGETFGSPADVVVPDATIASARDPHPVLESGRILLFFTALDRDGRGAIGLTVSEDGGTLWSTPAIVLPAGAGDADGLYAPSVRWGTFGWEMWFELRDGVSSRLEYAASVDGASWLRDESGAQNVVLTPADGFEARAVSDPFVFEDAASPGLLRLYYAGASDAPYSIGLVERWLP